MPKSFEVECHLDHSTSRIRNVPQPRDIGPITTRVMHKSRLHRILEVERGRICRQLCVRGRGMTRTLRAHDSWPYEVVTMSQACNFLPVCLDAWIPVTVRSKKLRYVVGRSESNISSVGIEPMRRYQNRFLMC
jgi:hypothetical protein